jgi:hypothetical protein
MNDKQRDGVMASAIKDNDGATLGVVLRAPAWLSGHSAVELEMRVDDWRRRHAATQANRLGRLRKAIDALDRGANALVGYVRHVADSPGAKIAEAAAARTAAAIAAATPEAA